MEILVGDIVENIKKTFNDTKVFSVETIYEKSNVTIQSILFSNF